MNCHQCDMLMLHGHNPSHSMLHMTSHKFNIF